MSKLCKVSLVETRQTQVRFLWTEGKVTMAFELTAYLCEDCLELSLMNPRCANGGNNSLKYDNGFFFAINDLAELIFLAVVEEKSAVLL